MHSDMEYIIHYKPKAIIHIWPVNNIVNMINKRVLYNLDRIIMFNPVLLIN